MAKPEASISHPEAEFQERREDREPGVAYANVAIESRHDHEAHDAAILTFRAITEGYGKRSMHFDGKANFNYATVKQLWRSAMASLAVTSKGQVTLKRDLLQHLGIEPGGRIDIEKLPDGELRLRAARPAGTIDGFLGLLAGKTRKVATIEDMNEAAAAGWAGDK